jgi:hypothetical protein
MKKKHLITKIALLFSISIFAQTYTAPKTLSLPTFDGNGNDAVWAAATWQNMDQVWIPYNNILPSSFTTETGTQVLNGANDFSGKFKILWSETSSLLVFLVEIKDDAFIGGYTQPNGNYPNFDVLEIFIDENKSGGNHLFDLNGNNAENAFAYHITVNEPSVGQVVNTMTGAMDLAGSTFSNIVDYQSHFANFSLKNQGNGIYVYEFSLKVYKDTYDNANPSASQKTLTLNDNMGITLAYCDNDQQDGQRDHFIASTVVSGANNNNSYIDASIFGGLILGPSNNLSIDKNNAFAKKSIYPNPFNNNFNIELSPEISLENTTLKIYDVCGREVENIILKEHKTIIENSNLNNGLYFYKIMNQEKLIDSGRLISK